MGPNGLGKALNRRVHLAPVDKGSGDPWNFIPVVDQCQVRATADNNVAPFDAKRVRLEQPKNAA
jgi:hypothetical protein